MDSIKAKLDAAREELLDLSLRNKLLNYRPLKSKGVEVIDGAPEKVFRILVLDGQVMSFQPRPDEETEHQEDAETLDQAATGGDNEYETPDLAQPDDEELTNAERHQNNKLQTPYTSSNLQKRLLNTSYTARTYIQEQGVNVLYLAVGMLHWYESGSSDIVRKAPLILVPVELYRTNVSTRFRVRYTGDFIGGNLSLRTRLRSDFGMDLPELPVDEDIDVEAYFDQVETIIGSLPQWQVDREAIALAFFSFGSFLMYNDLDAEIWPEEARPDEHPILRALLEDGFQEPPPLVADDANLDAHVDPEATFQVVDADSSQTLAILDINQGRNLIIQGPPGTGKSQTITNLIAEALGQDKTVLFVAEKMAALEVVKRRLDEIGLGEACLELHSHKTNKKEFLKELDRTLHLGQPRVKDHSGDLQMLVENREHLNAYCKAVNTPIAQSSVTPHRAYGRLLQLAGRLSSVEAPVLDGAFMEVWTDNDFRKWRERITNLQMLLSRMGKPVDHPFWGSEFKAFVTSDKREIQSVCNDAGSAAQALQQATAALAKHLGLPTPANRRQAQRLLSLAKMVLDAPALDGVAVLDAAWANDVKVVKGALVTVSQHAELYTQYESLLLPEAWEEDLLEVRTAYINFGQAWWRFLSGDFRRARHRLAGLVKADLPQSVAAQRKIVEAIMEARRLQPEIEAVKPLLARLFTDHWQGVKSDCDYMVDTAAWLFALYARKDAGSIAEPVARYLTEARDNTRLRQLLGGVQAALEAHETTAEVVVATVQLNETVRFGDDAKFADRPFVQQLQLLGGWYKGIERLSEIVSFNHQAEDLRAAGLDEVVTVASTWDGAGMHLSDVFQRAWYEMLLGIAMTKRPALAAFNGETHQYRVEKFREADELTFQINRTRLANQHWQQLPRYSAGGQLGILQREFAKKRRHLPIRQLMMQAGRVVQTIKPVFMMSPMSIAQFLPPGSTSFDLVVFDEASQVRPVDAFGAILRGQQVVVVGDDKQLPPSHFFSQIVEAEDDEESPTADLESVLSLFSAQGAPQRMLRWHYRSQHDSLIAVSNYEFYNNRLLLFPSPDENREDLGLSFRHLPETTYDRGRSRTNREEALAVAKAVMDHARRQPDLTLGVAAFSISQTDAIQSQLELLRRQDASAEPFFRMHSHEPFFAKNLENVQGDERDIIFISVGYGRDQYGKVTMNFGPINHDGGERRLNVLTTRARKRCVIFSNLTDEDIDLSRTNARGAVALKRYLKYARTGDLDMPTTSDGEAESPFEEAVADALREQGHEVVHQVGAAGFFIDLAIRDPERPGRYLLGIECDGASYHSAQSARDRDRLRQQVLEGMGWQIYRIWSTDWFQNPKAETRKAVAAIEAARVQFENDRGSDVEITVRPDVIPAEADPIERVAVHMQLEEKSQAEPYVLTPLRIRINQGLHEVHYYQMARWVEDVVAVESPIHVDDMARRIVDAANVSRMGSRIRAAIDVGVQYAVRSQMVWRRGNFLWNDDSFKPEKVRTHADVHDFNRTLEQIAPEEILLAVQTLVQGAFGMQRDEIPSAVCALLGFGRTSQAMHDQVDALVGQMIDAGGLVEEGQFLVLASDRKVN